MVQTKGKARKLESRRTAKAHSRKISVGFRDAFIDALGITHLGYTGEMTDASGLVYLRARYYNPATATFLSRDPFPGYAHLALSRNGYSYVHGNPVNHVDPSGMYAQIVAGFLGGAAVGGGAAYAYYQAALSGKCGCEKQKWAESLSDAEVAKFIAQGAFTGGVSGALYATGPIGRLVVGVMGVGFGSAALYGGVDDILNNGANPCNVSQAGFGLAGIIGGLGLIGRNARPAGQQASGIVQQIRQLWRGGGNGWHLPPKGGAYINGRWYTEHALERMAPRTPEVMAELEARALSRIAELGHEPFSKAYWEWWKSNGPIPRGIPLSVVEAEIANPGSTDVTVILNEAGDVVTIIGGGGTGQWLSFR